MRVRGLTAAAIVEAAAELADADWRQEVSPTALARKLGVRTPSLYNHLQGQDDLRQRLATYGVVELTRVLSAACVGRSGSKAWLAMATAYRDFALSRPGLYQASMRPEADGRDQLLQLLYRLIEPYELPHPRGVHFLRAFRCALHGFVSLELMGAFQLPVDREESFQAMVAALIAAIELPGA